MRAFTDLSRVYNLRKRPVNQHLFPVEPVAAANPEKAGTSKITPPKRAKTAPAVENQQDIEKNIFQDQTVVAENEQFQLVIVRSEYNHNHRFHLQDHKYVMQCELKNNAQEQPKLMDLLNLLFSGIENVLQKLKVHYRNPDHEHQVYTTVVEENIKSGNQYFAR
jgi:hypothetical protein